MGTLLHLVKISEDFYILFSGFVIKCFFFAQLIKQRNKTSPTVTKALTLQFTFLLSQFNLFQENFNRSPNCYFIEAA